MRGARGWVIAAIVSLAIAGIAYLLQPRPDSPQHSSTSDAANGTSALVLFAQAMGHPTIEIGSSFVLPSQDGVMFVFTPTSPYTATDADRTAAWVRSGGVLIYASEDGDPELDRALGVSRIVAFAPSVTAVATPVLVGVTQVAGGDFAMPLDPAPEQVPILRTRGGSVLAFIDSIGSGRVVVLADPLVLCNGYLEKLDNGRLAANLLGIDGASAPIAFDEYHHGFIPATSPQRGC